ncbi:MAG: hypothetical protein KAH17_03635 [Bacteroidales bacterium]|nr:hypothetical protein [Bacteroidales bacterium]
MNWKKKEQKEFISPRQEIRESRKITAKDLLGGGLLSREIVVQQIPYALFLFAILLFYIGNQYRGDGVMKEIIKVEEHLKELRTESVSTAFELMEKSKQTRVIELIKAKGLNLQEAIDPPVTIEVK